MNNSIPANPSYIHHYTSPQRPSAKIKHLWCSGQQPGEIVVILCRLYCLYPGGYGDWRRSKTRKSDICSLVNEVLKGDIRTVFIKILPDSFSLCWCLCCVLTFATLNHKKFIRPRGSTLDSVIMNFQHSILLEITYSM